MIDSTPRRPHDKKTGSARPGTASEIGEGRAREGSQDRARIQGVSKLRESRRSAIPPNSFRFNVLS
jgi:hypothetical protein